MQNDFIKILTVGDSEFYQFLRPPINEIEVINRNGKYEKRFCDFTVVAYNKWDALFAVIIEKERGLNEPCFIVLRDLKTGLIVVEKPFTESFTTQMEITQEICKKLISYVEKYDINYSGYCKSVTSTLQSLLIVKGEPGYLNQHILDKIGDIASYDPPLYSQTRTEYKNAQ